MPKNPQVNLDITAKDKASKILDEIAGEVEDLEKSKAVVGISADDDASKVLDEVTKDVKALDKEDAEITLRAKADALQAELRQVKSDLAELERSDTKITVDADVDKAKSALKDVEDAAERSGGGAGDKFGASFVRDVGGPLNEGTAGVLGDITDAFSTAGESIGALFGEKTGAQFTAIAGKVATAFGVGSIAFIAITTLWDVFKSKGDKAVDDAVKKMEGAFDTLADTFQDEKLRQAITDALTPDQMSLLGQYGIFLDDIVKLIRGEPIAAVGDLEDAFRTAIGALGPGGLTQPAELAVAALKDQLDLTADEAQNLYDKAVNFKKIEGIVGTQTSAVSKLRDQFRDTQAFVQGGTKDVETFGRTIRGLPEDKAIAIYPDLRNERETEAEINNLTRDRNLALHLRITDQNGRPINTTSLPPGILPFAAPPSAGPVGAAAAPVPMLGATAAAPVMNFSINVRADRTTDQVALGKAIVAAIQSYERMAGASWRR